MYVGELEVAKRLNRVGDLVSTTCGSGWDLQRIVSLNADWANQADKTDLKPKEFLV